MKSFLSVFERKLMLIRYLIIYFKRAQITVMMELYLGDCISSTVNVAVTVLTLLFRMLEPGTWRHSLIDIAKCGREGSFREKYFRIFAEYNQQDATFHNLFISARCCTCFRQFFRPSSGGQNCTYSVRHLSDRCCYLLLARLAAGSSIGLTLYVQFWSPDDGRNKPSETCTVSYRNNEIVKRCIFLVVLCECFSDARTCGC